MTVKITITWSLNVCINYFTLPCWLVKRVRPVHSLKVLKFLSYVFATVSYSKLVLILLQREEFAAKSNVKQKDVFL